MPGWEVAGYDLEQRLGGGATGEVWCARAVATGDVVAVKLVRTDSPAARERLRRAVTGLADIGHPHLVRLRDVATVDDGVAVVSDFVGGRSLASLLAERRSLTAGEIVTVGVPLASALAALHQRDLCHGAVTPANVLFTPDGRPLLSDFGMAGAVDGAGDATPADDVLSLGAVLDRALPADAPTSLRVCVSAALGPEPAARPTAAEVARCLRSAALPTPVRLGRPDVPSVPPKPVRRLGRPVPSRAGRPPAVVLAGVPLAVVAAVLAGRAWAAADRSAGPPPLRPPPTAGAAAAAPASWLAVLSTLDQRRSAALANTDPHALAGVYAAGSAPLAADAAAIRQLVVSQAHTEGLRLEIRSVALVRRTPARVTLRVVDRLPAYEIVGANGQVLERRPGRGPATWTVELVPAGDGWRIAAVTRA